MQLARREGVEFEFDASVTRIEVNADQAQGVVLANADLPYVYKNLLPQDNQASQLERKRCSCLVISFF